MSEPSPEASGINEPSEDDEAESPEAPESAPAGTSVSAVTVLPLEESVTFCAGAVPSAKSGVHPDLAASTLSNCSIRNSRHIG